MEINNRKSRWNFEFVDNFTAGIKLAGSEVRSIREGEASIDDAFCLLTNKGIIIKNMYVKEWKFDATKQDTVRDRVLLLEKSELNKIRRTLIDKSLTIIPTRLFFNSRGLVKINIALAKGKKTHEKRNKLKENDIKKDTDRELKKVI